MTEITCRITVSGRVQGVFFRDWTVREARQLGLSGWVRNLDDGRVEALATGAPDRVNALVARCHRGPERARVDGVAVDEVPADAAAGFERR